METELITSRTTFIGIGGVYFELTWTVVAIGLGLLLAIAAFMAWIFWPRRPD